MELGRGIERDGVGFGCGNACVGADLLQVRAHGFARRFGIVSFNGFKDALVVNLAARTAAVDAENAHALFFEQADDGVDQRQDERIAGGLGEREMEIIVGLDESLRLVQIPVHHSNGVAHGGEMRFLGARGGQCGDLGLENLAHFHERGGAFRVVDLHHQVEGLADGLGRAVGDERAAARVRLDQTFFSEDFYGLANCGAADVKLLSEFGFGGKLIARLERASEYRLLDLPNNLFVEPQGLDGFIHKLFPDMPSHKKIEQAASNR